MQTPQRSQTSARPVPPAFIGHRSPFIRAAVVTSLLTLALVTLDASFSGNPAWAMRYFGAGIWALVFFALTPLIIKAAVFDGHIGRALALMTAKFVWIGLMIALCVTAGSSKTGHGALAIIAGVTTPLAVVTLQALGSLLLRRLQFKNRVKQAWELTR